MSSRSCLVGWTASASLSRHVSSRFLHIHTLLKGTQKTSIRNYAAAPQMGKKAKGGQAKTAIKSGGQDANQEPALPLFVQSLYPSSPFKFDPEKPLNPADHNMKYTPTYKLPYNILRTQLDINLREKHSPDDRFSLFDKHSPKRLPMGSVVLVEYVMSRTNPVVHHFAGVLCCVVRKGIATSFMLRHYVASTGVEMTFKVFSPNILNIKVLRRVNLPSLQANNQTFSMPGQETPGNKQLTPEEIHEITQNAFKNYDMDEIRSTPRLVPIPFSRIDEMVMRDRETQRKLKEASKQ